MIVKNERLPYGILQTNGIHSRSSQNTDKIYTSTVSFNNNMDTSTNSYLKKNFLIKKNCKKTYIDTKTLILIKKNCEER